MHFEPPRRVRPLYKECNSWFVPNASFFQRLYYTYHQIEKGRREWEG